MDEKSDIKGSERSVYTSEEFTKPTVLSMRLDTEREIKRFEAFLRGREVITIPDETDPSKFVDVERKIGDPLCNTKGVQYLKGLLESLLNTTQVQGNYEREDYEVTMSDILQDVTTALTKNAPDWDITPNNIDTLYIKFKNQIRLFLTRPIGNKERESYTNVQYRQVDTLNKEKERGGFFG